MQSVTLLTKANAGGWTGPRHTPLSTEPTRAADVPPWRSSCRPGSPGVRRGSAARSRTLRAGVRRARAAAHGRVPSPWEGSLTTNRRFLSPAGRGGGGGGAEICQVHVQENKSGDAEDAWRGRGSGNRPSSGALLSRLELPPRARARGKPVPLGLDRDGLPGRAGVSQGSTRAPRPVRPAPQGSGTARGPRPTNGRNGSGQKDLR